LCDLGPSSRERCDYVDYAISLVERIKDFGILICGSGIGMSIVANRFPSIYAALCLNTEMAIVARKHNNANVLVLSADFVSFEDALKISQNFLLTDFENRLRYVTRISKIDKIKLKIYS